MSRAKISYYRPAAQRARLERLRGSDDPVQAEERRTALRALIRQPLLLPFGEEAPAFALVRRHAQWLADWFAHHADWTLSVTPAAARLRKYPADLNDGFRGLAGADLDDPFTRGRYVLLCLALAALERTGRQITLGRLAEHIRGLWTAEPALASQGLEWSLNTAGGRRDYVQVLRFLVSLGLLHRLQGEEERLLQNREADVLYNIERPVLALLLATRRSPSLILEDDFALRLQAIAETPRPDTLEARNRAHRTGWGRRLLDDPVCYHADRSPEEQAYFESQRVSLLRDLTEATGFVEEARSEGVALVDLEGDCTDSGLPEEGTEGHLALLLTTWMAEGLRRGCGGPLPVDDVRRQAARFIRQHRHHWRKAVTETGAETWLTDSVLHRLAGLGLIAWKGDQVTPRPALGRFALRASAQLAPALPEDEAEELPA